MKVLYDYQAFGLQKFGGISNCFANLIKRMPEEIHYEIAIKESDNVHLRNWQLSDVEPMRNPQDLFLSKRDFKGKSRLYNCYSWLFPHKTSLGRNRLYSIKKLQTRDYDVFHPTFFDDYFLSYLGGKPFVLTIHDMIPELLLKDRVQEVRNKAKLGKKASHIIAVSEKTKQDIIDILQIPEEKITVIYHGAPSYEGLSGKAIIDKNYLLFVGVRNSYKFFLPMVKNLVPFLLRHKDVYIVCTGHDFTWKETFFFQKSGIQDRMIHVNVNDELMANLYSHAICLIFPSLYEGFGIPILEAYKADCPVLLNNKSCFPEIAQDAAVYFNLDSVSSDLEDVMENFYSMSGEERDKLIQRQRNRLEIFSWKASAQKLAEVYMKVLE